MYGGENTERGKEKIERERERERERLKEILPTYKTTKNKKIK